MIIAILMMGAMACLGMLIYPLLTRALAHSTGQFERYQQVKVDKATKALDDIFMEVKPRWLKAAYGIGPITAGLIAFLVTNNLTVTIIGVLAGLIVPDVLMRQARAARQRKFKAQLVDVLFILSSSLRAGLSLPQAFEQLESEMPIPASQEFGLMMKAHRLGRSLEESLQGLNERMPCDELNLITTAVLVARETGGDITTIISQMIGTIRERKKLMDKVTTLTLQGRLQAYVMSGLPVAFALFIRTVNPRYFDILLNDSVGKQILIIAASMWLVGMVLLFRFCKVDV